ncbi:hypothetical protein SAMN05892883_2102 [Jatrophihabitans sp. GAS493]|nr:hypothetical protein [Jatrophihabitans sp. GAS493]SOD72758.1 hypothetical protein SAMN05892883_2102 [Jatrophihabitans sp. GAS493]
MIWLRKLKCRFVGHDDTLQLDGVFVTAWCLRCGRPQMWLDR